MSPAARIFCCLAVAAVLLGCASARPPVRMRTVGFDPAGRSWLIGPDSAGSDTAIQLPDDVVPGMIIPRPGGAVPRAAQQTPLDKLQPTLRKWWKNRTIPADSELTVIVALHDTLTLPEFPTGNPNLPHSDSVNVRIQYTADSLVAAIRAARDDQYDADSTDLHNRAAPVFRSRYWLIQGYVLDVRFSRLVSLAASPRVVSVRPRYAGESAPACTSTDPICPDGNSDNDLSMGAKKMQADVLHAAGYGSTWLGVMDTGIRDDHEMLITGLATSASRGGKLYACVESCPTGCATDPTKCTTCPDGNPGDLCGEGHGTGTAGILIGDGSKDPQFRGLTAATLDWFDVYNQDCHGSCKGTKDSEELDACAVIRAFETAVNRRIPVIVAEMQAIGNDLDPINLAAANAFSKGCAIIAANGNSDEIGTDVACPAREATVIGVGARYYNGWDLTTPGPAQTVGPVNGRYKPDILGPTNLETTSRCDKNSAMAFSYTSGATAFVGGAAGLLFDLIRTKTSASDAGHTYAQLILAGNLTGNLPARLFRPESGAGLTTIQSANSLRWLGKVEFAVDPALNPDPTVVEFIKPLYGNIGSATTMDVAVWWPEAVTTSGVPTHRRIKLELIDPSGVARATSADPTSVFQRVSYPGAAPCSMSTIWTPDMRQKYGSMAAWVAAVSASCWKVRISTTDNDLRAGAAILPVYWAAVAY